MKRRLTFIMGLLCLVASAQNIDDVLRYSEEDLWGTARFRALSGAFGALGGDISAIGINGASAAVMKHGVFSITGSAYNRNNDASYNGGFNNRSLTSWRLGQVGATFIWDNSRSKSGWNKIALTFNYELTKNFDNAFAASGTTSEGIDNYFLNFAQGQPFGDLLIRDGEFIEDAYLRIGSSLGYGAQQAFLGYYGGIIDPVDANDDANTAYVSNAEYDQVVQNFLQTQAGRNNRFSANLGTQYKGALALGATFNFHNIYYERVTRFDESNYLGTSQLTFMNFDNLLRTNGNGFSFNVGAIARVHDNLRLGGSYQSPTWYTLRDETSQAINSNLADADISFINFSVVNLFESYKIVIPQKFRGSAAIVFGAQGLISFDYTYQDMSKAELQPLTDPSFTTVNEQISQDLGEVATYRLGGELRFDGFSLRAGYRFEESPYKDQTTIGNLEGYSGGIGINFGASRLDFAYARSEQEVDQRLFDTGIETPARVNKINNTYTATFTVNF